MLRTERGRVKHSQRNNSLGPDWECVKDRSLWMSPLKGPGLGAAALLSPRSRQYGATE